MEGKHDHFNLPRAEPDDDTIQMVVGLSDMDCVPGIEVIGAHDALQWRHSVRNELTGLSAMAFAPRVDIRATMDPRIILLVPPMSAKLAGEVDYYSGRINGALPDDADHAAAILNARVGSLVEIVFPLPVDPIEMPYDAVEAAATATNGGVYIYLVDAFMEPSRGERVKRRVVFREGGRERRLDVP